jgi:hypothetical protein
MNSPVYIDLPIALVSIYFLRNIFSLSFTIRFPTCAIIICACISLAVLRYVTAILSLVSIKPEHNAGIQGGADCVVLLDWASNTLFCVRDHNISDMLWHYQRRMRSVRLAVNCYELGYELTKSWHT